MKIRTKIFTNESDVKRVVKQLLDAHNWFWWCPPANGYGKSGISDFNALRDGVFLAIETKFGYNKPTAMQNAFMKSVTAEGGFVFVVSEKNIVDFEHWLNHFDLIRQ